MNAGSSGTIVDSPMLAGAAGKCGESFQGCSTTTLKHKGSASGSYANFRTENFLTQGSICSLRYNGGEVLVGVASGNYCPCDDNEDETCFLRLKTVADTHSGNGRVCIGGALLGTGSYQTSQHLAREERAGDTWRTASTSIITLRMPSTGMVQISFDEARTWEPLNPVDKPLLNLPECYVYVGLCAAGASISDLNFVQQNGGRPVKSAMKMNKHAVVAPDPGTADIRPTADTFGCASCVQNLAVPSTAETEEAYWRQETMALHRL